MRYLETERLEIRLANFGDEEKILDFYRKNKDFLEDYESYKSDDFYTLDYQKNVLSKDVVNALQGNSYRFYIYTKNSDDRIIGSVSINSIIRGSFQSAIIGYKMDEDYINRGYMTEALEKCLDFSFSALNLHRVEANVMPRNVRSRKVLEKLGFKEEGLAQNYLEINGVWEDHYRFSLINNNFSY